MDAQEFQTRHGVQWAGAISSGMLYDALAVCNNENIQDLSRLTPDRIQSHGREILATFVGRLALENALISLSVLEAPPTDPLPPETYEDPQAETETPAAENPHQVYVGPFAEYQAEQAAVRPQPTKRRKRRKRRKRQSKPTPEVT